MKIFLHCVNLWFLYFSCISMNLGNYYKQIIFSILTCLIIITGGFSNFGYGQNNQASKKQTMLCSSREKSLISGGATGIAGDNGYDGSSNTIKDKPKTYPFGTKPLQIQSKPIATFTDEAKQNCVEGTVILKITFFADGTVGNFRIIKGLGFGLSEEAISAAKRIKFEPAAKNNKNITVSKTVTYSFTIY